MYNHHVDYQLWQTRTEAVRQDVENGRIPNYLQQGEKPPQKKKTSWLFRIEVTGWRVRFDFTRGPAVTI